MTQRRNLSGIYFRVALEGETKPSPTCFEDLPLEEQRRVMGGNSKEWLESLVLHLAGTLREVGDQFDIAKK